LNFELPSQRTDQPIKPHRAHGIDDRIGGASPTLHWGLGLLGGFDLAIRRVETRKPITHASRIDHRIAMQLKTKNSKLRIKN